jgi:hypothetical protein
MKLRKVDAAGLNERATFLGILLNVIFTRNPYYSDGVLVDGAIVFIRTLNRPSGRGMIRGGRIQIRQPICARTFVEADTDKSPVCDSAKHRFSSS